MGKKQLFDFFLYVLSIFYIIVLSSYLIILNDPNLILYSFVFFIIIGFLISYKNEFVEAAFAIAVFLIALGSLYYLLYTPPYAIDAGAESLALEVGLVLLAFATLYLYACKVVKRSTLVSILTLIGLFEAISIANFQIYPYFYTNLAIIGYYLLISMVLGLIFVVQDGLVLRSVKRLANIAKNNEYKIKYTISAMLFALIFLPVWYAGNTITYNTYPYIYVKLSGSGLTGGNSHVYFLINATKYESLINPAMDNLGFFTISNEPQYAERINYSSRSLMAIVPAGLSSEFKLVFMPFNNANNSYLIWSNMNDSNYKRVNASFSTINNVYDLQKYYKPVYGIWNASWSNNQSAVIDHSYTEVSSCLSVTNANISIDAFSTSPYNDSFSMFLLDNSSAYSEAQNMPFTSINNSLYPYMGFSRYSMEKMLNGTTGHFSVHLGKFNGCMYVGIIAAHYEHVFVNMSGSITYEGLKTLPFYAPASLLNSTEVYVPYFGNILQGIYYLYGYLVNKNNSLFG